MSAHGGGLPIQDPDYEWPKGEKPKKSEAALEDEIMDHLVNAWNGFLKLEPVHPDEQTEFRHTLHELQRMIMVRKVHRWAKEPVGFDFGDTTS